MEDTSSSNCICYAANSVYATKVTTAGVDGVVLSVLLCCTAFRIINERNELFLL